jgi:DNA-binding FrmR family transcriptional regulator
MKSNIQRINNIVGQLEGIKKLLQLESHDCLAVLVQLKAAKAAMGSLMQKVIETEFESCSSSKNDSEQMKKLFIEMVNNK